MERTSVMYEGKRQPLISAHKFILRIMKSVFMGTGLIVMAELIGMWGYHTFEEMTWIDAFVNAAMILSGMGPLSPLKTTAGKLFAGFYALFSGLAFILIIGIVFAPIIHRFFHQFHLDEADLK